METRTVLKVTLCVGFALALSSAAALAADDSASAAKAPPGPPHPAAEMDLLKVYTGKWTCDGMTAPMEGVPAHKTKANVKGSLDLDGFWVNGTVDGEKTKDDPMPIHGVYQMTYDPSLNRGRYIMRWIDNMGMRSEATSTGWNGQTQVFDGQTFGMGAGATGSRDTFTKKGDDLEHVGSMMINGKWVDVITETCKRAM